MRWLFVASALTAATAAAEPVVDPPTALPAEPVIPVPRAAPARPLIFEAFAGISTIFPGSEAGSLGVRATRRAWSAELAFDLEIPETKGMVDVWRGGATIAVCRHLSLLGLCPIAQAGWVHGAGGGGAETEPLLSVGGRLELELQITHWLAVRTRFDGRILVTSTAFTVDGITAYTTPRAEAWLGIDVLLRIPR